MRKLVHVQHEMMKNLCFEGDGERERERERERQDRQTEKQTNRLSNLKAQASF